MITFFLGFFNTLVFRVFYLQKNLTKCVARRGFGYGSEDILCGNTGSVVALTSSFRASINADKIPSPSLFLSYVTLDGCFDKRKNEIVTRGKSVSRGDKNSSEIYGAQMIYDKKFFTLELLISLTRGIYVTGPVTGPVLCGVD